MHAYAEVVRGRWSFMAKSSGSPRYFLPLRDVAARVSSARPLAKLRHPHVVSVHEVGEHDSRVYIAMELVDGVDLRDWLSSERRSWQEIVACFVKAGNGLAAAHDAGLVHRDFKPDNVLVARDGDVLVADFGLARSVEDDPVAQERVRPWTRRLRRRPMRGSLPASSSRSPSPSMLAAEAGTAPWSSPVPRSPASARLGAMRIGSR